MLQTLGIMMLNNMIITTFVHMFTQQKARQGGGICKLTAIINVNVATLIETLTMP